MAIGIWGYGKIGKALTRYYLKKSTNTILIMDKDPIDISELKNFKNRISFYTEKDKQLFFKESRILFVSPGVDIRKDYQTIKDNLSPELDLFFCMWEKQIIAITGSNGKTSITHFLDQLLKRYGIANAVGGNIGTPTIELIEQQADSTYALLEVSSFQLEHIKQFSPDLAIITNLSENHLDRHLTMESYFLAKYNIIRYQQSHQRALVPLSLYSLVMKQEPKSQISVFCLNPTPKDYADLILISHKVDCFMSDGKKFVTLNAGIKVNSIDLPYYKKTFDENILILTSILFLLGCDVKEAISYIKDLKPLEHRFEFVTSKDGIDFFNDSKSTTMQSTIAAINEFKNTNIFLLVGGLSKGVNRAPLFEEIKNKVSFISCFGSESEQLSQLCIINKIPYSKHENLTDAFQVILKKAQNIESSVVLFSPAGSSYDLFKNYEDRGLAFKRLVLCLLSD